MRYLHLSVEKLLKKEAKANISPPFWCPGALTYPGHAQYDHLHLGVYILNNMNNYE
jgi:hypothetical protein